MSQAGGYWSIGEVLSLLQDEFPEITISKIRFLESQGLISPERTPSGYRRFYQNDFDLLRWILIQQRDHYLPLKVIRDRIEAGDVGLDTLGGADQAGADTTVESPADTIGDGTDPASGQEDLADAETLSSAATSTAATPTLNPQVHLEVERTDGSSGAGAPGTGSATDGAEAHPPANIEAGGSTALRAGGTDTGGTGAGGIEAAVGRASSGTSGDSPAPSGVEAEPAPPLALTKEELAESARCSVKTIVDLERYGLVRGRKAGPTMLYDQTALTIARIAAQFGSFGLEPRHLRTFLIGAEREMGLVHQVVEPMLHRRDEETRRKARDTLDDLTDLAASLRSILMRQVSDELLPKR